MEYCSRTAATVSDRFRVPPGDAAEIAFEFGSPLILHPGVRKLPHDRARECLAFGQGRGLGHVLQPGGKVFAHGHDRVIPQEAGINHALLQMVVKARHLAGFGCLVPHESTVMIALMESAAILHA